MYRKPCSGPPCPLLHPQRHKHIFNFNTGYVFRLEVSLPRWPDTWLLMSNQQATADLSTNPTEPAF